MFANLTYEDKRAFFELLDEYFESRPHLTGGGGNGNIVIKKEHALAAASAAASAYSSNSGRTLPPLATSQSGSTPPYSPSTPDPKENKGLSSATRMMSSGMNKVTSNSHVSSALGKVGAGGLANKFNKPSASPTGASADRDRSMPPAPPPSRGPQGAAGLTSGKSFGHVDMSSGGAAFKSMWKDPKKSGPPAVEHTMAPALGSSRNTLPPPVRRDRAGSSAAAEPAHAQQAQALYDYAGGDSSDLPVHENQVVTIVEKTSDDWWTCEDDSGRQGLVPANYLKQL